MSKLSYAKAGVNVKAAGALVKVISSHAAKTRNSRVKTEIGGYASLYEISKGKFLAASTDGVGTKLKLAFDLGIHDTVGIDLVAMSVNDILCVGARPLFFLDYFATGGLKRAQASEVIKGISQGCKLAGCALVGGETAEMPGFYQPGEYDLAGFAVGEVAADRVLPGKVRVGDVLIGVASSGFHSNGYSLLRKILSQESAKRRKELSRKLLTPTKIYVESVLPCMEAGLIHAAAHITGAGFLNLPRMDERFCYSITLPESSELPEVFEWEKRVSGLSFSERARTFNLGLGMVLAVSPKKAELVLKKILKSGEKAWVVGHVSPKGKENKPVSVVITDSDGNQAFLTGSKTS